MKEFLTEIITIDGLRWAGPIIKASSWKEAEEYCQNNGLGYCNVIGVIIISFTLHDN